MRLFFLFLLFPSLIIITCCIVTPPPFFWSSLSRFIWQTTPPLTPPEHLLGFALQLQPWPCTELITEYSALLAQHNSIRPGLLFPTTHGARAPWHLALSQHPLPHTQCTYIGTFYTTQSQSLIEQTLWRVNRGRPTCRGKSLRSMGEGGGEKGSHTSSCTRLSRAKTPYYNNTTEHYCRIPGHSRYCTRHYKYHCGIVLHMQLGSSRLSIFSSLDLKKELNSGGLGGCCSFGRTASTTYQSQ